MYSLYYLHSLLIRTVQHTVCSTTGILYGTAVCTGTVRSYRFQKDVHLRKTLCA